MILFFNTDNDVLLSDIGNETEGNAKNKCDSSETNATHDKKFQTEHLKWRKNEFSQMPVPKYEDNDTIETKIKKYKVKHVERFSILFFRFDVLTLLTDNTNLYTR